MATFHQELQKLHAKLDEVMRLFMLAAADMLESGEIASGDPELDALVPRCVAVGLKALDNAVDEAEMYVRRAKEYAAAPGGKAMAEVMRKQAASAVALAKRAVEYVAFMRRVGALPRAPPAAASGSSSEAAACPATVRPRRPNTKYFGPEWTN